MLLWLQILLMLLLIKNYLSFLQPTRKFPEELYFTKLIMKTTQQRNKNHLHALSGRGLYYMV